MDENEIKEVEVRDRLDGKVDPANITTGSQVRMSDITRTMKDFFQKNCGEPYIELCMELCMHERDEDDDEWPENWPDLVHTVRISSKAEDDDGESVIFHESLIPEDLYMEISNKVADQQDLAGEDMA